MRASHSGSQARAAFEDFKSRGLRLNMQRGQPSDADFDLSNGLLHAVGPEDVVTAAGVDVRNYGGVAGLAEARALFAEYLDLTPEQVLVWNNASLELQAHVLTMLLLRGTRGGHPWAGSDPKIIVTVPGYDRHFTLLAELGFQMVPVQMQADGPDVEAIAALAAADAAIRGVLFVPTYANPGGETISATKAERLVAITAAAGDDFVILADDAYRAHHLDPAAPDATVNLVELSAEAGKPDRSFVFASTSKITFAGAGLGFVGSSAANIDWLGSHLGALSIGPNKIEQLRHVKFLRNHPGGLAGLMARHAELIAPRFAAVAEVLAAELGGSGLARWTEPRGGYFISLDTTLPVADRVIALANEAGVSLTPAGATYPEGNDPNNSNIRLAPTRPELAEVRLAMHIVATCIRLASEEYERAGR